jgi:hypothetical protein
MDAHDQFVVELLMRFSLLLVLLSSTLVLAAEADKAAPSDDSDEIETEAPAPATAVEKTAEKPAEKNEKVVTPAPAPAAPAVANSVSQDGEKVDPRLKLLAEQALQLCHSTDEYIKTLSYLRETKDLILPERTARKIALKVSRGCDGAAERFEKTLRLLRSVGLSDPKALEVALQFSGYSKDTQKNFMEIFGRAYLAEFLDYDYAGAVALALELSRDYHGDAALVREDFIALSKFCRDSKSMDLPTKTCSQYAVKMARLSQFFPYGVKGPFIALYTKLREDRDFGLDVKTALDISYNILKNGPAAPDNFMAGYAYAMKEKGLSLGRNQALEFALKMAVRSFAGDEPPAIPAVSDHGSTL